MHLLSGMMSNGDTRYVTRRTNCKTQQRDLRQAQTAIGSFELFYGIFIEKHLDSQNHPGLCIIAKVVS
jgi:hypothetical protein